MPTQLLKRSPGGHGWEKAGLSRRRGTTGGKGCGPMYGHRTRMRAGAWHGSDSLANSYLREPRVRRGWGPKPLAMSPH